MKIILASASPRRRELLEQIGLEFEVHVSNVNEQAAALEPGRMVEELSRRKAEAVLSDLETDGEDVLVIGADTVVVMDGRILGKPSDSGNAAWMLENLSGRTHEVYTGVTLLYRPCGEGAVTGRAVGALGGGDGKKPGTGIKVFHEMTKVSFYPMTGKEISDYVSGGDCMDKAGAYGIQGLFARYVKGVEGDYNNVVGLPVGRIYQEAREWLER